MRLVTVASIFVMLVSLPYAVILLDEVTPSFVAVVQHHCQLLIMVTARCVLATLVIDAPLWSLDRVTHDASIFFTCICVHMLK